MNEQTTLIETVSEYFQSLQSDIVVALEELDGKEQFRKDAWGRPGGGGGESRVLIDGAVFEQGGVNFSHVFGKELPPSATRSRPELAGRDFTSALNNFANEKFALERFA